jgi:16S rRNA (guanine(966)-N(2))-methyltransferase RsmD
VTTLIDGEARVSIRVIAGSLKGRRLETPTWDGLRPTSDRLRETIFNILAPRIAGARVLDGYAGTGALGIEALSRGAAQVTFVESDPRAQRLIAGNLAKCGVAEGYAIIRATAPRAFTTLSSAPTFVPFDIILLDPPYDTPADTTLAGIEALVASDGLVMLEHSRKSPAPPIAGRLVRTRELAAGASALAFYTCQP